MANVTVVATVPFGATGGWVWMIVARSRRTMIRCTPVWGPAPCLYFVSGFPFGWRTTNETRTGLPATIGAVGVKFTSVYCLAA